MSSSKPIRGRRRSSKVTAEGGGKQVATFSGTRPSTRSRGTQVKPRQGARFRGVLAKTTDKTARKLMMEYRGSLTAMAMRINTQDASIAADDLVQVGWIGLMEAWHYYDPNRGAAFWTFAYRRVLGAMMDEARNARYFGRNVLDYKLEQFDSEIADIYSFSDAAGHQYISTDVAPEFAPKKSWVQILAPLKHRQRQIVSLSVIRELALHRIGALYGVTSGRISQIVTASLRKLRDENQEVIP